MIHHRQLSDAFNYKQSSKLTFFNDKSSLCESQKKKKNQICEGYFSSHVPCHSKIDLYYMIISYK